MTIEYYNITAIEEFPVALARCEVIIIKGFVEAGKAFKEIREDKLWKGNDRNYKNFEDYCQRRWGHGRQYIGRLIQASIVIENLLKNGVESTPNNVYAVQALEGLSMEQKIQVWKQALEDAPDGQPTAKQVKKTRKAVIDTNKGTSEPESIIVQTKEEVQEAINEAREEYVGWLVEFRNKYSNIPTWELDEMMITTIKDR